MSLVKRIHDHLFADIPGDLVDRRPHTALVARMWPYVVAFGFLFDVLLVVVVPGAPVRDASLVLRVFAGLLLLSLLPLRAWMQRTEIRWCFEVALLMAFPFAAALQLFQGGAQAVSQILWISGLIVYGTVANPRVSFWGYLVSVAVVEMGFAPASDPATSLDDLTRGLLPWVLAGGVLVVAMGAVMRLFAVTLQNQSQLQRVQERNHEFYNSLMDISTKVTSAQSIHEAFEIALQALGRVFPNTGFALYVEDPERNLLLAYQATGLTKAESLLIRDVVRTLPVSAVPEVAAQQRWPLGGEGAVPDTRRALGEASSSYGTTVRPQLILGGPMNFRSGDIVVSRVMKFAVFGEIIAERRQMLEVFKEQLNGICRQIVQAEEIERYAHTDSLTGLFNRSYFEKMFPWLTSESLISQAPLTLIFCDVNGLKRINDDFGHHEGDKLIREAARAIRESCRRNDYVFRLGGDEIVILCPGTTYENAQILIQRILTAMKSASIRFVDEASGITHTYDVQVSMGAASTETVSPAELLLAADRQMLIQKETYYRNHARYR